MKSFYWPLLLSLVLGRTCLVAGDKNASSDGKQVIKICEEDEYCEDDEDSGEGEVGIDDLIDPVGAFNELITADYKCGDNYVEAVKKALKRVPDSHKRFCLSTAPEIFEALKNGKDDGRVEISKTASWNDSALLLTIGWAIAESGWKSKRKCLWGFACSAKTMNEGVQSLVQYLYGPKNNGCAPHRALTKNFEDKNISKIWSDDRLNLLLRSSGYAGRASAFYNDRLPGEI
ncbi:MAG TPA: hypothetical protein VI754_12730, partial [Bacteriovoracaceae bacterium]|nr:hypothetical protein [Bacteriovoracaceae bacterium]